MMKQDIQFDKLLTLTKKYKLNLVDLKLISYANTCWNNGDSIRVTDLMKQHEIASPSTIHSRVTEHLIGKDLFVITKNPQDAREKFVVKGQMFKTLLDEISNVDND